MDKYITITSQEQDPADFISNFADNIYLEDGYEVGLKAIYHAPVFNILERDNHFRFKDTQTERVYDLDIPIGFYESQADILGSIYIRLMNLFQTDIKTEDADSGDEEGFATPTEESVDDPARIAPIYGWHNAGNLSIAFKKPKNKLAEAKRFQFYGGPSSPLLRYLGYILPVNTMFASISAAGNRYTNTITPAYIYTSCVGNSIIDQQQSRLLAVVPLASASGYVHFENNNPNYVPLATQSLRDVSFAISDVDGNPIRFEYRQDGIIKFPTILVLHVRKTL